MSLQLKTIESKDNKTFKELLKLKKGDPDSGLFLAEGEDLIAEAIKCNCVKTLIYPFESKEVNDKFNALFLKEALYRELSSYQSLPKVMGVCRKNLSNIKDVKDKVIYLDNVQDPGNVGTIIRTALSFNYTDVVLSPDSVSIYNSKVIQSSKGAIFHINITKGELSLFKNLGYNIYLTTLDGQDERNLDKLQKPFILVFGNEGRGIRQKNLTLGEKIKIEMSGIDSLNVAIAAGIMMYRFK